MQTLVDSHPFSTLVPVIRPKYAWLNLSYAVRQDPKSKHVMDRLSTLSLPIMHVGQELEMTALESEPGEPFREDPPFAFASATLALSFFAHIAERSMCQKERKDSADKKLEGLDGAFCSDPRPIICLDPVRISGESQYLVLGIGVLDEKLTPQLRLLPAHSVIRSCGGYYRPVGVKLPEVKQE